MPFSWIYSAVLFVRNWLFDHNLLKSTRGKAQTVVVGNLSLGGTGKTPHSSLIIRELSRHFSVALLSRGYGRKSKGFYMLSTDSKASQVGDEPLLLKKQNPTIPVAVCENRIDGIDLILKEMPSVQWVVLDDAYQHRALKGDVHVLLSEYNAPFFKDFVLPSGRLRDHKKQWRRADVVIITKCPANLTSEEMQSFVNQFPELKSKQVLFSKMKYGNPVPVFNPNLKFDIDAQVFGFCGIARPDTFQAHLVEHYSLKKFKSYPDHHGFTHADIATIRHDFGTFDVLSKMMLTTEKDAMRLLEFQELRDEPIFYIPIEVEFIGENQNLINTLLVFMNRQVR
jgi:tetraacyldisaccharide 4'-kinase